MLRLNVWILHCLCHRVEDALQWLSCCVTAEKWLFQMRPSWRPVLDPSFLFNPCFGVSVHWLFSSSDAITLCVFYHFQFVVRAGFSLHSPIHIDLFIIVICKEDKCIFWRHLQEWSVCSGNVMATSGSLLEEPWSEIFRSQTCFSAIRSDAGL